MRRLYTDDVEDNQLFKFSFYNSSQGYVAFRDWVGYTTDSGRTFTKKYITLNNVDMGNYGVNFTFGFGINGVKAFNQNNVLVYGHYAGVPAILYSNNGANSFTLILHTQYDPDALTLGIMDMVFPGNGNIGYAVDADRIWKSTNQGLSWTLSFVSPGSGFNFLEASDASIVLALSTQNINSKLLRTISGGSSWSIVPYPPVINAELSYATFISSSVMLISVYDENHNYYLYKSSNGGFSWTFLSEISTSPLYNNKIKFTDANTGFALTDQNTVSKTFDGGLHWEPLPRDNNYSHLGFSHNDLQCLNGTQLWAGGGHGFLEINTNAAGNTLPKAYFGIDTNGVFTTSSVNLVNRSRPGYSYQWLLNGTPISTSYSAAYLHDIFRTLDTVTLIVSNGITSDTSTKTQTFPPPVIVSSFEPATAPAGAVVTITGSNFNNVIDVKFGTVAAASFTVVSSTSIRAVVGNGVSGNVTVTTSTGQGFLPGFTYMPPPTITSFSPVNAAAGSTVTITGTNFTGTTSVSLGGVAAASYTVVSSTTITAIAPSGPGGNITVVTPAGSASLSGFISLPTISSFSPNIGTQGSIITITGTSLTGASAVTVGGTPVMSFVVNSSTSITAIAGNGASGNVTVTTAAGNASAGVFTWIAPPVITSFAPQSGPPGTSVTVTGSGFNTMPSGNIVFFGTVKATVNESTATTLTVTVPTGATHQFITVTNNNLTAYSAQPFIATFANGGSITENSFTTAASINTNPDIHFSNITVADIDGDNKNDLVVSKLENNQDRRGLLLYRNNSSSAVSFEEGIAIDSLGGVEAAVGDLDGDGKPDLAVIRDNDVTVLRNISTAGSILYSKMLVLPTNYSSRGINIHDADGDGKPDIIVINYNYSTSIFRNTTEPGNFRFAARTDLIGAGRTSPVIIDLDGDKKPEIITADFSISSNIRIFKNNSSPASLSFNQLSVSGNNCSYLAAGDIDGDGKTDLVYSNTNESQLHVLRNISTTDSVAFAPGFSLAAASLPTGVRIADMDGDGKVDIVATLGNYDFAVYKNNSTPGSIDISNRLGFEQGLYINQHFVALADVNTDGKADVITMNYSSSHIGVYKNEVKREPFIHSFTPTIGQSGTNITISGANFINVTGVYFGGVPAASFTVNSSSSITAAVGTGRSGEVMVTNNLGSSKKAGFVYGKPPFISSFTPTSGPVGSTVVINGANFSSNPANNIVFFGGAKATVESATNISLTVTVPFGSMYDLITVAVDSLAANSNLPFITTFQGTTDSLYKVDDFAPRSIFLSKTAGLVFDFDTDGMLDIVSNSALGISVLRNTGRTGTCAFREAYKISNNSLTKTAAADIDGDGKPDVIFASGLDTFFVCRNLSAAGTMSFSAPQKFISKYSYTSLLAFEIRDLDLDGKPDVVVAHGNSTNLYISRNISTPGNIAFEEAVPLPLPAYPNQLLLQDINGDKKPEIILSRNNGVSFTVRRNTSVPGNISFAGETGYGTIPGYIVAGDLDADGKTDITLIKTGTITIFKNTFLADNISFADGINLSSGVFVNSQKLALGDMDGDSKPDLLISNPNYTNTVSLLKNKSTVGNFSFAAPVSLACYANPDRCIVADMDNDTKTDIVATDDYAVSIWRNQMGIAGPVITSFSPVSAVSGDTVVITGQRLTDITSVSFGGKDAASFNLVADNLIEAVVDTGNSGIVIIKSTKVTASLGGFIYGNQPRITDISSPLSGAGKAIIITGANLTGASQVSFGGVAAASYTVNAPDKITAYPGSGASGNVVVTTPAGMASFTGFTFAAAPVISSVSNMTANISTVETIKGYNFTGASAVSFGGYPAQDFTVSGDTLIVAYVGYGGSGKVSVTTPGGIATRDNFVFQGGPSNISFFPASGTTGTKLTIKGTNIGNVNAVQLGGVNVASFNIESITRIEATIGSGATGNLSLTTPNTTSSTAGFIYLTPGGMPAVHSFAPAIAGIGSIVEITGVNFTGVTGVKFGGVNASSFTVHSTEKITAVVATGSSGDVSVINNTGTAILPGFIFTNAPVISSFNPVSAPPGTNITLTGANFNTTASANNVYFGTVKASVVSAAANKLVVKVPVFTPYAPVTVINNSLSGKSTSSFLPTFAGKVPLDAGSYYYAIDSMVMNAGSMTFGDADLDGRPDINIPNNKLTIFTNSTASGRLSVAPAVSFLPTPYRPNKLQFADLDGDGKLDIFSSNTTDGIVAHTFKNNSIPGTASFTSGPNVTDGPGPFTDASADFDGDGKPDIAFIAYSNYLYVSKNTSTPGNISFAAYLSFSIASFPRAICIPDVDRDGKQDVVVCHDYMTTVARNISTPGNIAFTMFNLQWLGNSNGEISAGDIDGDGKDELIFITDPAGTIAIVKNRSTHGNIILDERMEFNTDVKSVTAVLADIDGDSKPDIIAVPFQENKLSILINNSIPRTFAFLPKFDFVLNAPSGGIAVGDLDGDGKPEIGFGYSNAVSILKNKLGGLTVNTACANGVTTLVSNITGASYQWQQSTGDNNFVNINNGSNFSGTNTATLQILNMPSAWYGYRYRCRADGNVSSLFQLNTVNTWTGAVSNAWENAANWSCAVVPDANTDVVINEGNIIINSNITIRTLSTKPAVSITVNSGFNITVIR